MRDGCVALVEGSICDHLGRCSSLGGKRGLSIHLKVNGIGDLDEDSPGGFQSQKGIDRMHQNNKRL